MRIENSMDRRALLGGLLAAPLTATALVDPAPWDVVGQRQRRAQINSLFRSAAGPLFDAGGKWIGTSPALGARERLWSCLAFLESAETRDKANAIIEQTFAERSKFRFTFSHFEFITAAQLLRRDSCELSTSAKALLLDLLREALAHQGAIQFLGYNDNFPAMENVVASLGGDVLDDAAARKRGVEAMHRLLALLDRRGMLSEYTSATYCPVTMMCYAEIAERAQDAETRKLALEIERRVWMDIATHFHAPTNILAGPHSRAYAVDSVGHMHQVGMMLYLPFGERAWMNPVRFMFPPVPGQVIHHDGDVPFMQVSTVWISSATYHPTPEIERVLFDKRFPFRVSGTSEYGAAGESIFTRDPAGGKPAKSEEVFEYPAGAMVSTTYMTEDYAVGSATAPFLDGNQTDVFFANFRRAAKPETLRDVSTIFSRYTIDEHGPGRDWTDPRNPGAEVTKSLLGESGRVRAVQKDNTVLAVYQSKGQFTGEYKGLRLTLVVPVIYRSIRRVRFAGKEVKLPFTSVEPGVVSLEDDYFYAAFRPLNVTNLGRPHAVRIQEGDGYLAINFINYEGPLKRFSRHDLLNIRNGFVAEIGGVKDYGSFAAFERKVMPGEVTDTVQAGQRAVEYARPGVRLTLSHSVLYDGLKYALVDGQPIPQTKFQFGDPA